TAPGVCSQIVAFAPVASDNCPGTVVSCSPTNGSTFAKGTNAVTCTATDASGNTANCSFNVVVEDHEPPVPNCPAGLVFTTDGGQCNKTNVTYTVTVNDNCPGASVVCDPASGSTFAKGQSTVSCTATDASGNT